MAKQQDLLSATLAAAQFPALEQQALLESIRQGRGDLERLLRLLLDGTSVSREQVAGALLVKVQDLRFKARRLASREHEEVVLIQRQADHLVLIALAALTLLRERGSQAPGPHSASACREGTMTNDMAVDILLVEDNPNDAELALRALKKHNLANSVEWVKDGAAALYFLFHRGAWAGRGNGIPRLVLLDLRLPKVDGIEVLQQIRACEATRALPVVVLTSSKEERDLVATYQLGVNSFVSKPVAFDEFARTVADLGLYWMLINRVPPGVGPAS